MSNTEITDEDRAMLKKIFGGSNRVELDPEDDDLKKFTKQLFHDNETN